MSHPKLTNSLNLKTITWYNKKKCGYLKELQRYSLANLTDLRLCKMLLLSWVISFDNNIRSDFDNEAFSQVRRN